MQKKSPSLILCVILDIIGYFTYIIPGLGEFGDIIWAPISAYLFYKMYGSVTGVFGGLFNFVEEILPWTDFIPTFTLVWLWRYFNNRTSADSIVKADDK